MAFRHIQKSLFSLATCALLALPLLSAAPLAHAQDAKPPVTVEWVHPEHFSDVGNHRVSSAKVRTGYLDELARHLVLHATPLLISGHRLDISITDVDMAGDFESGGARAGGVRVIRDIYPPRITLHFKLTESDGALIREDTRELQDLLFQSDTMYRGDPLRYEKTLIDSWLDREMQRQA